jgi:hypothetical protein
MSDQILSVLGPLIERLRCEGVAAAGCQRLDILELLGTLETLARG